MQYKDYLLLSLKFQSITHWSYRWEAVKTFYEQLEKIIWCLINQQQFKNLHRCKMFAQIYLGFLFFFDLCLLRIILMNKSNLNSCFQWKQMDIFSLHKILRNDNWDNETLQINNKWKNFRDLAIAISYDVKQLIKRDDSRITKYQDIDQYH